MRTLLLNGSPIGNDALAALALVNYGHFTSMQVRGGCIQGLDLHRKRLQSATMELFGSELDFERARAHMRQSISERPDCSLRVTVFCKDFDYRQPAGRFEVDVLVSAAPPSSAKPHPVRIKSYLFSRMLPHIKHVGTFPLFHHRRLARQSGYDDALFVDAAGAISEGSVWNIGFVSERTVVWPNSPALGGTAAGLLKRALAARETLQEVREVCLDELASFDAAFACNAAGVWPIGSVDGVGFCGSQRHLAELHAALASQAWDAI